MGIYLEVGVGSFALKLYFIVMHDPGSFMVSKSYNFLATFVSLERISLPEVSLFCNHYLLRYLVIIKFYLNNFWANSILTLRYSWNRWGRFSLKCHSAVLYNFITQKRTIKFKYVLKFGILKKFKLESPKLSV